MKRNIKRLTLTALATIALFGTVPAGTAAAANEVACDNNRNDFLMVYVHWAEGPNRPYCFANGGEIDMKDYWGRSAWMVRFWTGNNRVQWYGDGRWQPNAPVEKWTQYEFPNHPGGVKIQSLAII